MKEYHTKPYRKCYLIFIFIFLFLSCKSLTGDKVNNLKDDKMIKCLIKQVGVNWDVYYITVNENCLYNIKKGVIFENQNLSTENISFQKITDEETIQINDKDCKILKELISSDKQQNRETLKGVRKGGWEIHIMAGERKHEFYMKEVNDSIPVNKIFNKLKKISTIDINLQWR